MSITNKKIIRKPAKRHSASICFQKISEQWLSEIAVTMKPSTYTRYRNLLTNYILPYLAEYKLTEIDYTVLTGLRFRLLTAGGKTGNGLSAKTVSDTLSLIRTILKYAAQLKYPIDITAYDVSVKVTVSRPPVLSRQNEQRLLSYLIADPSYKNIGILTCLFTGIRIGELCALTRADIGFDTNTLHIHQTMQRVQIPNGKKKTQVIITTPKSTCSIRDIPIPQFLLDFLPCDIAPDAFLLTGCSTHYIEPRSMENHFRRVLSNCEIPYVNFHVLRHTFATRCIELGFDLKSLSEILGHANVNITLNRYVHPSTDLKQENMTRLSQLFVKSLGKNIS